jgi:hypothetical protein
VDDDEAWREGMALEYKVSELEAMCTWLDQAITLNQSKIEVVTTRIGVVFGVCGVVLSVLIAAVDKSAWSLTTIAVMLAGLSMFVAASGLRTEEVEDIDPTSTWETMWGPRYEGELQAVLYRRRSIVYDQQRGVLETRIPALKVSSWMAAAAVVMTGAAALVSRVA